MSCQRKLEPALANLAGYSLPSEVQSVPTRFSTGEMFDISSHWNPPVELPNA